MRFRFQDGVWNNANARRLLIVSIVDSTGNGAFTSASVVLFSTVLGLTATQIGQGIAAGALVGLGCSVAWGALADRLGARSVLICLQLWRALGFVGYAFVHTFAAYVAIAVFLGIAERASPPIRLAFVTSAVPGDDRVKTAGAMRSIRNAGFTLGALLASVALLAPGRPTMLIIVIGNAATFAAASILLHRIQPLGGPTSVHTATTGTGARIRRRPAFLTVTALTGLLSIHRQVLTVGLPLWIVLRELAPKSMVSVLVAVNTVLVVVLQVRLTRRADDAPGAARSLRRSGWLLLATTALFAAAGTTLPGAGLTAPMLLVLGTLALTLAEMWQTAGSWGLSLALSPEAARARFLTVFNLGSSALDVTGALILTVLVLPAGPYGWLVLGGVLAVTGLVLPPVAAWADAERRAHEGSDEAEPERATS